MREKRVLQMMEGIVAASGLEIFLASLLDGPRVARS